MNYKKNEAGDVMVRTEKGVPKYVSQKLAEDAQLMKAMHLIVVQAPIPFCEEFGSELGGIKSATLIDENGKKTEIDITSDREKNPNEDGSVSYEREMIIDLTEKQVAETTPAKRGRKPNQK